MNASVSLFGQTYSCNTDVVTSCRNPCQTFKSVETRTHDKSSTQIRTPYNILCNGYHDIHTWAINPPINNRGQDLPLLNAFSASSLLLASCQIFFSPVVVVARIC